jgi:beta-lactamase regulating signal transducer with metallopeptidase domain
MLAMKSFNLFRALRTLMLVISLGVGASALTAYAQNTAPAPAGGGGATTSSQTTTSKTTTTEDVARVNPIWWIVGGIALLLILLIVIMASRGRGVDVVRERSTTVKKE